MRALHFATVCTQVLRKTNPINNSEQSLLIKCLFCAYYSATTPTKATQQNYAQISKWKPRMLTIDFPQIMDLSKLHTTEAINLWPFLLFYFTQMLLDNLQRICLGGLGWSSRTVTQSVFPIFLLQLVLQKLSIASMLQWGYIVLLSTLIQ